MLLLIGLVLKVLLLSVRMYNVICMYTHENNTYKVTNTSDTNHRLTIIHTYKYKKTKQLQVVKRLSNVHTSTSIICNEGEYFMKLLTKYNNHRPFYRVDIASALFYSGMLHT